MFQIQRVLYCTDFSSYSNQAYFHAVAVAEHHGAELYVCHVLAPGADGNHWREQLEQIRPANPSIPVQHVLLEGESAGEIVRYAAENGMNIIVIGTHGRTGLDRTLMGSVAEQILREAHCSVLIIKLPKAASVSAKKREAD